MKTVGMSRIWFPLSGLVSLSLHIRLGPIRLAPYVYSAPSELPEGGGSHTITCAMRAAAQP